MSKIAIKIGLVIVAIMGSGLITMTFLGLYILIRDMINEL